MKKLLSIVAALLFAATTFAKESELNEVTLTTIGTGASKEQAVNQALRSAIEQSFGTFISANTNIVNDALTKDEIVSLSSGNIKKYEELSCAVLKNGETTVSLRATVSIKKLTTYAKSHGSQCEFAGNTFAQNMKLRALYSKNEAIVIDNMLKQLELMTPNMFQYSISVTGEPKEAGKNYYVPVSFSVKATENSEAAFDLITTTINSVRLDSEISDYESTNSRYYSLEIEYYSHPALPETTLDAVQHNQYATITINGKEVPRSELRRDYGKAKYYFRNPFPTEKFVDIINSALNFNVYALMHNSKSICQYNLATYGHTGRSRFYLARTKEGDGYGTTADIKLNNFHLWSHLTKSTDTSTDFLIAGAIKKAKAKKYNAQRHYGSILVENGYIVVNKEDMNSISGFEIAPPNKTSYKQQERRRYRESY